MAVRCGRHDEEIVYHESVDEVRRCFSGESIGTAAKPTPVTFFDSQTGPAKPATEKQINFVNSLLRQNAVEYVPGISSLDRRSISSVIQDLKSGAFEDRKDLYRKDVNAVPPESAPNAGADKFDPETLEDGFYVRDESVYKVIVAVHGSGRKYAKALDPETGRWEMARGAVHKLRPEMAMTLDQALDLAKVVSKDVNNELYGRCFICGRTLTDDDSIDRGIGPICLSKMGG
jgi:hypothetical protein